MLIEVYNNEYNSLYEFLRFTPFNISTADYLRLKCKYNIIYYIIII